MTTAMSRFFANCFSLFFLSSSLLCQGPAAGRGKGAGHSPGLDTVSSNDTLFPGGQGTLYALATCLRCMPTSNPGSLLPSSRSSRRGLGVPPPSIRWTVCIWLSLILHARCAQVDHDASQPHLLVAVTLFATRRGNGLLCLMLHC